MGRIIKISLGGGYVTNEKIFFEVWEEQQEMYFNRLERMNKKFIIADIVRSVCITILVIVYIYMYFHTPYLTKNYNHIQDSQIENYEGGK